MNLIWRENELAKLKSSKYYWIRGIVGLYPSPDSSNVLYALIHGKSSIMMEVASDTDLQKGFKYILQHVLLHYEKPMKIYMSKWMTDQNIRGSHTYNTISSDMFEAKREDLAEPIKNTDG